MRSWRLAQSIREATSLYRSAASAVDKVGHRSCRKSSKYTVSSLILPHVDGEERLSRTCVEAVSGSCRLQLL